MRLIRSIPAIAVLAFAAACDLSTEPRVPAPIDPANDTYAPSLGVDIASMTKTASGLYYKNKTVGTGAAVAPGDSISVHYTLWMTNGTKIQSSKDGTPVKPFEFLTGTQPPRVIAGFEEGVIGMQPGGVRQLVIPTHLAWSTLPGAPVPPNSNVVFEIEYLERKSSAQ